MLRTESPVPERSGEAVKLHSDGKHAENVRHPERAPFYKRDGKGQHQKHHQNRRQYNIMGRKNRSPEKKARRAKIRELLQLSNVGSM